jgi:hypothetical protein
MSARERLDHRCSHAADFHALGAAMLARRDSNSRQRDFQICRQVPSQRFICPVIDRRCRQTDFEPILPFPGNFIAARPGLHAHDKTHRSVLFGDLQEFSDFLPLAKERGPHANFGRALFNGHFEVI